MFFSKKFRNLAIWTLVISTLIMSCAPQATPTVEAPQVQASQPQEETEEDRLSAMGYSLDDNNCLYSKSPQMRGADCMARDVDGKVINPYQSVGCIINGQKVGNISPKAGSGTMAYVNCDEPLTTLAVVFVDEEQMLAAATYLGPGTRSGWDDAWSFYERIWSMKDDFRIMINQVHVEVLGCHVAMEGWYPESLPQYARAGLPSVDDARSVDARAYIRVTYDGGATWDTWTHTANLTGLGENFALDQFRPICPSYGLATP